MKLIFISSKINIKIFIYVKTIGKKLFLSTKIKDNIFKGKRNIILQHEFFIHLLMYI